MKVSHPPLKHLFPLKPLPSPAVLIGHLGILKNQGQRPAVLISIQSPLQALFPHDS
jgi:hypothetical protein